jgi:uncharacterized protein (TIGR03437 family)
MRNCRTAAFFALLAAQLPAADSSMTLRIVAEDTPAGGTVQVKVFLEAPQQVASGALTMDFDPAVFGDIANIGVFSATGDASAYAHVDAGHVDVHFWSPSASIGQLPDLPVFVVSIPVLAAAPAGTTSLLTADPAGTPATTFYAPGPPWTDGHGNQYTVTILPAAFHVGGSISISNVSPAAGVVPARGVVKVKGIGFDATTSAVIDGVAIASTQFVTASQIDLVLAGPVEMTGRHVVLAKTSGEEIDHFVAPSSTPQQPPPAPPTYVWILPPIATYTSVAWQYCIGCFTLYTVAVLNPTAASTTITYFGPGGQALEPTLVPPGALAYYGPYWYNMTASAAVRMIEYSSGYARPGPAPESLVPPQPQGPVSPTLAIITNSASQFPTTLAPGELISLFGMSIGPAAPIAANGPQMLLGATQLLINGQPAPLLYASASQINAIVPYEIATTGTATVQVVSNGLQSATWGIPVAPSAPAIFTADSTGIGQAAVLNQDNSPNSASHPAYPGSVIQIFATGGGQTNPASVTGTIAGSPNTTALPVTVTIGGIDAPVTYHGSAPGLISSLLQVNAVVPPGVRPDPAVPIAITVGGNRSQHGITIAIE